MPRKQREGRVSYSSWTNRGPTLAPFSGKHWQPPLQSRPPHGPLCFFPPCRTEKKKKSTWMLELNDYQTHTLPVQKPARFFGLHVSFFSVRSGHWWTFQWKIISLWDDRSIFAIKTTCASFHKTKTSILVRLVAFGHEHRDTVWGKLLCTVGVTGCVCVNCGFCLHLFFAVWCTSVEDCNTVVYIGLVYRKEALTVAAVTHNRRQNR